MLAKSIGLVSGFLALSLVTGGDANAGSKKHGADHGLCIVHGHYGAQRVAVRYRSYYYTTYGRVYFKRHGERTLIYGRVHPPTDWAYGTTIYREPYFSSGVTVHRGPSVRVHTHC